MLLAGVLYEYPQHGRGLLAALGCSRRQLDRYLVGEGTPPDLDLATERVVRFVQALRELPRTAPIELRLPPEFAARPGGGGATRLQVAPSGERDATAAAALVGMNSLRAEWRQTLEPVLLRLEESLRAAAALVSEARAIVAARGEVDLTVEPPNTPERGTVDAHPGPTESAGGDAAP